MSEEIKEGKKLSPAEEAQIVGKEVSKGLKEEPEVEGQQWSRSIWVRCWNCTASNLIQSSWSAFICFNCGVTNWAM